MADFNSPFYPYQKVYGGFFDGSWSDTILKKIVDYLLDMPDSKGYVPKDDNTYPRTSLWKYLYYDGANPTDNPLPTPKQKKQVLFNPNKPEDPPTTKGYRLFPQAWVKPSQTEAQTRIYVNIGRIKPENDFKQQMAIEFTIWTHYTQEANTKEMNAQSRAYKISQCITAALHGVHIDGVGSFYFNASKFSDCGNNEINDRKANVGRHLIMGLEFGSEAPNDICENDDCEWG